MTEHERPQLGEQDDMSAFFAEITASAAEQFGENALYKYGKNGNFSIVTLAEAIKISGQHWVDFPVEAILEMLKDWYYLEPPEDASYEEKKSFEQDRERGRQALARHVLSQEG